MSMGTSENNKSVNLYKLFVILCLYRVWNSLYIETQFDPDEYWQTLEPAYCTVFSTPCARTWEWTFRDADHDMNNGDNLSLVDNLSKIVKYGPVRSHVSILPTILYYKLIRICQVDTSWMISRAPLVLNAIFVGAPTDLAIFVIAKNYERDQTNLGVAWWSLLASITNWFHGYALVRTYSNSLECMLFLLGIMLTTCYHTKLQHNDNKHIPGIHKISFIIGGLSVTIRFTALAAWIPLGFYLANCHSSKNKSKCWKHKISLVVSYLLNVCAIYGIIGVSIGCLIDYIFYGYHFTLPFASNIYFNAILGLGSLYGTHPPYWYLLIGLPAISGVLFPFTVMEGHRYITEFTSIVTNKSENSKTTGQTVSSNSTVRETSYGHLWCIILFYVLIHSYSPHKEFRFLLPILPLVCILSGNCIHRIIEQNTVNEISSPTTNKKKSRIKLLCLSNLCLLNFPHLWFLSRIHQHAPIEINRKILKYIKEDIIHGDKAKHSRSNDNVHTHNDIFKIHYLMGCHSTPLYSHLHLPRKYYNNYVIDAWTLDCSPSCRNPQSDLICESEQFSSDPKSFLEMTYFNTDMNKSISDSIISSRSSNYCEEVNRHDHNTEKIHYKNPAKPIPNFMAMFKEDAKLVEEIIKSRMNMKQIVKIRHSISDISITFDKLSTKSKLFHGDLGIEDLWTITVMGMVVKIQFESMLLFQKVN